MDLNSFDEPTLVYPEKLFEMALRHVIQGAVKSGDLMWTLPRFGLDIAAEVRISATSSPVHIEIEVKSFNGQRRGGVGFGSKRGGPQVDLLLSLSNEDRLRAETEVRWAFADATQPRGSPRYALLTCSEASKVAMAGVARDKQNNFSIRALRVHWTAWAEFCENLRIFLHKNLTKIGDGIANEK